MILQPMRGAVAKRYDCGEHGRLTTREIAAQAGITASSVHNRIARGIRGDALCAPKAAPRRRHSVCFTATATPAGVPAVFYMALKLLRMFPTRAPSAAFLRHSFGMSRATAYRYRRAWLDVHGVVE